VVNASWGDSCNHTLLTKRMELQTKLKQSLDRSNNTADGNGEEDEGNEGEEMIDFGATGIGSQGPRIKGPKMSPFDARHDMGSHIHRFERYAVLQGWRKRDWAVYLAALLKVKALYVYARLPPEHAQDYDELKQALLKRYALTEEGYKQKFYESKQEKGESPQQFLERLDSYFLRWLELAKVSQSFDGVKALMVKERYLATCHKSLEIFLRERPVDESEELAKVAEQFQDAHGTRSRFSFQKVHQTSSSQRESVSSSSLSKPIEQAGVESYYMAE